MLRLLALSKVVLSAPVDAYGVVHKVAVPDGHDMTPYWWPDFPMLHGCVHEDEASIELEANVLVPSGKSFFDRPAVI